MTSRTTADWAATLLRLALSAAFLSAVADRFGLWGPAGTPGVAWGDMTHFTAYTHRLTSIIPGAFAPALAWAATVAEIAFALALLIGWRTRLIAALSAALLLGFALSMTLALGVKAPLDYSVFSAAAGAVLLACGDRVGFGVDRDRPRR